MGNVKSAALMALVGLALSLGGEGCSGKQKLESRETVDERRPKFDDSGKFVLRLDLNKDKKFDVWKIYNVAPDPADPKKEVKTIVRKEMDVNYDGQVDLWRMYNDLGQAEREELDMDFDGKVDQVLFFEDGHVVKKQVNFKFDERPYMWKYYSKKDELVRVEADTTGSGKVDYWEYFEGGKLDRIGRDTDGDGQVDIWQREREK